MWSNGRSEALLEAGLPAPIEIRPIRGAKRLRLRFDDVSGMLKLTCPPRTSRRAALAWALDQREWIEAQQARRYVVAHEVAHLKPLNHGPEFKALEARLLGPGVAEAKAVLRRVGPRLRRLGRGR